MSADSNAKDKLYIKPIIGPGWKVIVPKVTMSREKTPLKQSDSFEQTISHFGQTLGTLLRRMSTVTDSDGDDFQEQGEFKNTSFTFQCFKVS